MGQCRCLFIAHIADVSALIAIKMVVRSPRKTSLPKKHKICVYKLYILHLIIKDSGSNSKSRSQSPDAASIR